MVGVQRVFCDLKDIAEEIKKFEAQGLTKGSWEFHGQGYQVEVRAWRPKK